MSRLLLVISALCTGCAGVKVHVNYDNLAYPVSMSGAIPDDDGNLHIVGHDLEVLGDVRASWTAFGILYGAMTADIDVSRELNARVAQLGGQGVAQLYLEHSQCPLDYIFPLTILPFWPGCTTVTAHGKVVRSRNIAKADIVSHTLVAAIVGPPAPPSSKPPSSNPSSGAKPPPAARQPASSASDAHKTEASGTLTLPPPKPPRDQKGRAANEGPVILPPPVPPTLQKRTP